MFKHSYVKFLIQRLQTWALKIKRYRNEDYPYNLHPDSVHVCADCLQFNVCKSFELWKWTTSGKRHGCLVKATAVSDSCLTQVRKISEQGNAGIKTQFPCLTWTYHLQARNYLFLHSTVCKMLSKSLKPVFLQVTPIRTVSTLCKAKTTRANLQEC